MNFGKFEQKTVEKALSIQFLSNKWFLSLKSCYIFRGPEHWLLINWLLVRKKLVYLKHNWSFFWKTRRCYCYLLWERNCYKRTSSDRLHLYYFVLWKSAWIIQLQGWFFTTEENWKWSWYSTSNFPSSRLSWGDTSMTQNRNLNSSSKIVSSSWC